MIIDMLLRRYAMSRFHMIATPRFSLSRDAALFHDACRHFRHTAIRFLLLRFRRC